MPVTTAKARRLSPMPPAVVVLGRFAAYAALVLVLLALATALATQLALRLANHPSFVVYGGSMGDAVPVGSLAVTSWVDGDDVRVGDVILARRAGGDPEKLPVAHRVIAVGSENGRRIVETKGDANDASDPGVTVLGDRVLRLSGTIPYFGYVLGLADTPQGWALMVLLPAALLTGSLMLRIWGRPEPDPELRPRWQP